MSIIKQLCINKFNFPGDILNEIKSFCFYDIRSWETINFIRHSKNRINNLINNSAITRNNPYDFFDTDNPNEDEHWVFWIFEPTENSIQFQSMNCKCCGNYKFTNFNEFPNTIRCFCLNDDENVPPLVNMDTGLWIF
jgi:hypothetical protein